MISNQTLLNNRYQLKKRTGEDLITVHWHAVDNKRNLDVLCRVLKKDDSTYPIEDLVTFKQNISRVIDIDRDFYHSLEEWQGYTFIVSSKIPGISLKDYLNTSGPLDVHEAMLLVHKISDILYTYHKQNLFHGMLNPSDIYIEKDTEGERAVTVIGFGYNSIVDLSRLMTNMKYKELFHYIPPEGSGIGKGDIDRRSDLYSLGVLFFEILTGEVPFTGRNVNEVLHKHIAAHPLAPSSLRHTIPQEIDTIILKLLKKDKSERYQTAAGLNSDLMRYISGKRDFSPGGDDSVKSIDYIPDFIGRDRELLLLRNLMDKISESNGALCFIEGDAGMGKSRLVMELKKYVEQEEGLFLSSKCQSSENKMPYQQFHDILNELINYYEKQSSDRKIQLKDSVKNASGEFGEIILNLNPLMVTLIEETTPLLELDSDKESQRFLEVAAQFFCSLGDKTRPTVIFFDDIHWSDEGSLALMHEIAYMVHSNPILFVCAYRGRNVSDEGNMNKLLTMHGNAHHVQLTPLSEPQVSEIIINLLDVDKEKIPYRLVQYIYGRSSGNPFFIIEILRHLIDREVISRSERGWDIDFDALTASDIPTSVVEFILHRISALTPEEYDILRIGSIIGSRFTKDLLEEISPLGTEVISDALDTLMALQLIYRSPDTDSTFMISHDRVHETVMRQIDSKELEDIHLKAASALESRYDSKTYDLLFRIAHHYIEGGDTEKALQYSIPAANAARERYANEEAIRYYSMAIDLVKTSTYDEKLWITLNEGLSEIYLTIGRYDEAIDILLVVLPLIHEKQKKAEIILQVSNAYFKKGDWKNCEIYGKKGLELLGEGLPVKKITVVGGLIKEVCVHFLHASFPGIFIKNRKHKKKETYKLIVQFYHVLSWAYVMSDILKFVRITCRMLNISEGRIGMSRELGLSTALYGGMLMAVPLFKRAMKFLELSLDIRNELNDDWGMGQSHQLLGYCYEWAGDYNQAIYHFDESNRYFTRIGDIREIGFTSLGLVHCYYYLSRYDSMLKANDVYHEVSTRSRDYLGITTASDWYTQYYIERGNFVDAEHWALLGYSMSKSKNIGFITCMSAMDYGRVRVYQHRYTEAMEYLNEARKMTEDNHFLKQYTINVHNALGEGKITQYHNQYLILQNPERRKLLREINKITREAVKKSKKWKTHYGNALMLRAMYYSIKGRKRKARLYYQKSIEVNNGLSRMCELGKSYYEFGMFLQKEGKTSEASRMWQRAYSIFNNIQANYYLSIVQRRHGDFPDGLMVSDSFRERFIERRKLLSVITLSQQISTIYNLEKLLDAVVASAIELTGATRGFLFIYDEEAGKLLLKATISIEPFKIDGSIFGFSQEIVDRVFNSGEYKLVNDISQISQTHNIFDIESDHVKSLLCLPVKYRDTTIGVFYLDNLHSRSVFSSDDIELLNVFASQTAISIENARLYSDLEKRIKERTKDLEVEAEISRVLNEHLQDINRELLISQRIADMDMKMAINVQNKLLPEKPPVLEGWEVASYFKPMIGVSGDVYDYYVVDDELRGVSLFDVSGHGIASCLITIIVKTISRQVFTEEFSKDMSEVMKILNDRLINEIGNVDNYATGVLLRLKGHQVEYVNAGHPDIFLKSRGNIIPVTKEGGKSVSGGFLGVPDMIYPFEVLTFTLARGDTLILYTDGLSEAEYDDETYGADHIIQVLSDAPDGSAREILDYVMDDFNRFIHHPQKLQDDCAVIVLKKL